MSKIKLEAPFRAFRGKICKHSEIIYKRVGNTQFTSQICNPRTSDFSEEERTRQNRFRLAVAATKDILLDDTLRATATLEFKAQSKYTTLRGYIVAREYAKLLTNP